MVFDVFSLDVDIVLDDVCENLRELGAGDVVLRRKNFSSAVNIIRTNHRPDVGQRPVGNLAAVGKCRQVCFGIRIVVQFQRTGNDRHGFLPRNRRVRGHC